MKYEYTLWKVTPPVTRRGNANPQYLQRVFVGLSTKALVETGIPVNRLTSPKPLSAFIFIGELISDGTGNPALFLS
tara:strand:+ start:1323 stop:1550 length:228 start_codon:yes stop_codon:yes gene_type:complete